MLAALWRLVGVCSHRAMYREHREIEGRVVACYVCDCGHVQPIVQRTPDEHLKAFPARARRV